MTGAASQSIVVEPTFGGELYCARCETSYASGTACPRDGAPLLALVAAPDPLVGRELDGRFTILEKLGQGGMGCVYRAAQHSVNREVAIKVVHANLVSDPAVIKRFLREAKLASRLSHPNAVSVMDFGQTDDGLFYLVMELLDGKTLDAELEHHGTFDARKLIRVGMAVCDALEAAHALSIIHRDLKPSNIMMLDTARDFVKVLDFGLAKSLANETMSEMTGSGNMIGTPAYMPPERACGESGDARSDLYSLGCILYLLGTGELPFDSLDMQDLLVKQVTEAPPPMTCVPWTLAQVVDRLLRKDPALRYQTASETRVALEAALDELPYRSGSQPGIVLRAATMSGPHLTQLSAVPGASGPMVVDAMALERLERSDTLAAPVAVVAAVDAVVRSAPAARHRTTGDAIAAAIRGPRARWYLAATAAVVAATVALVTVASSDPASAASATLSARTWGAVLTTLPSFASSPPRLAPTPGSEPAPGRAGAAGATPVTARDEVAPASTAKTAARAKPLVLAGSRAAVKLAPAKALVVTKAAMKGGARPIKTPF